MEYRQNNGQHDRRKWIFLKSLKSLIIIYLSSFFSRSCSFIGYPKSGKDGIASTSPYCHKGTRHHSRHSRFHCISIHYSGFTALYLFPILENSIFIFISVSPRCSGRRRLQVRGQPWTQGGKKSLQARFLPPRPQRLPPAGFRLRPHAGHTKN